MIACSPAATNSNGSGGSSKGGSGGNSSGGTTGNGGTTSTGGSGSGGTTSQGGSGGNNSGGSGGGTTAKGGSGGNNSGGSGSGGSAGSGSGGSSSGGSAGSSSGGSGSGGSAGSGSGGSAGSGSGGAAGSGSGGAAGSGSGGAAGSGSGGAAGAGSGGSAGGSGSNPPGWYSTKDWGVASVDWHGCVWTGVDCKSSCPAGITAVPGSTTSVTPADFTAAATEGGPYQVKGSVFNDYNSVALLGFDLNDTPKGDATQCSNSKRSPAADGPPAVAMPTGATGIAVNWSATKLPVTFRIQIQGVKGATDPASRWCATIKDAQGPSFVPFTDFNTTCWDNKGSKYNNEPISGVAFLVPGTTSATSPFDITVVGFAPGTSAKDAPGKAAACGALTGTIGSTTVLSDSTKAKDASSQRMAVTGKDCKKYIVNNNNWGQPTSTFQSVSFTGNSFSVDAMNGSGSSAPASFPSLYIGANGQTNNGSFDTWSDSGLPKQISAMGSAQSTFKWGGKSSGDFNAAYDIWFSKTSPTAGSYNDAISGFIMVWLYKPSSRQPIGSVVRQATIGGQTYDVWAGPRGNTSTGTDPAGRPVISYVATSSSQSFSANLKDFFDDAVSKADTANGITQTFSSSWYLTDVFAGFEIWSGGSGLSCSEFTAAIK